MQNLSYDDALVLLGYQEGAKAPLELLGHEYSAEGMARFLSERPDVETPLISFVVGDVERAGCFPASYSSVKPEAYSVYITDKNCVVSIDKPSVCVKSWYASTAEAAKALVG